MKNNVRRNNIKTKVISILTAIALWLYVIAVVDPDEKKVIENIPITISNANEVSKDGFVIYPKESFSTEITVEGKLSEVEKLNKNNIHIYGDIINPVEGQNIVSLRTNISNRVSRELKDNTIVVDLEKKVEKDVPVEVRVAMGLKDSVEEAKSKIDEIQVFGPRTLVNKVEKAVAVLEKNDDKNDKASLKLKLEAVDKNNQKVNVELSQETVVVNVKYIVEKEVNVKLNYRGEEFSENDFILTPDKVILRAGADTLKNIDYIYTEKLGDKELKEAEGKNIKIEIPKKVKVKGNITEVTITRIKKVKED